MLQCGNWGETRVKAGDENEGFSLAQGKTTMTEP